MCKKLVVYLAGSSLGRRLSPKVTLIRFTSFAMAHARMGFGSQERVDAYGEWLNFCLHLHLRHRISE